MALKNRIVTRMGYQICAIYTCSDHPGVIYAELKLDGETICSADLEYCSKRMKGLIGDGIETWVQLEKLMNSRKAS
jgi:hypothetical protein